MEGNLGSRVGIRLMAVFAILALSAPIAWAEEPTPQKEVAPRAYYRLLSGVEGTLVDSKLQSSLGVAEFHFAFPLGYKDSTLNAKLNRMSEEAKAMHKKKTALKATVPWWVFTEVRAARFPDVTASVDGKSPEAAAIQKSRTLPAVAVGAEKFVWPVSDETVFGVTASIGTIVGDPPRADSSGSDRLFWQIGVTLKTNYQVSEVDRENAKDVIGSAAFAYRRLNYLRDWTPPGTTKSHSDDQRAVAEFRLSWTSLRSGSATPFVYLTIDRSIGGARTLHFDRAGFMVEVDLEKAFGGLKPETNKDGGQNQNKT